MERDQENNEWMAQAPYLAGLKHKAVDAGFTVPEGYFKNLPEQILGDIAVDKLKEMAPKDGYAVPENYFPQLQSHIMTKVKHSAVKNPVKIWQTNFFKYAAAACLVVISAFFLYINQPANKSPQTEYIDLATEQMLFDIDEQVIIDYIQNSEAEKTSYKGSDAELENYILSNFSQSDLAIE